MSLTFESPKNETESQTRPVYEENEAFNASLDNELVEIAGSYFLPSQVLNKMDEEAYHAARLDFEQQQIEEFKDIIFNKFPTPIAHNFYRLERGYENDLQRLHLLRDTWESLIYVLYALCVGEYRCYRLSMSGTSISMGDLLSDKMHDRFSVMTRLLQAGETNGYDLAVAGLISVDLIERLRNLNQRRNGFSHEAAKSDEQARQLLAENYSDVLETLKEFTGLQDITLMRWVGQDGDVHNLRCEIFESHATTKNIKPLRINDQQLRDSSQHLNTRTVLSKIGDKIFSLSPFLHWMDDGTGHCTRLCYYKRKKTENGVQEFHYEISGISTPTKFPASNFEAEINGLRSLLPTQSGDSGGTR
ncbi:MAG: hypothetical protein QOJ02_916 [Acidobacteriota bacterium]|jgi:hypothetical protein|nr:hypothetical protein [Acidobacteriota bacterium]